jgi:hypothetical protein
LFLDITIYGTAIWILVIFLSLQFKLINSHLKVNHDIVLLQEDSWFYRKKSMSSMHREREQAQKTCYEFWRLLSSGAWYEAQALLSEDFTAYFPQSDETISNPQNYIEQHRRNPQFWSVLITNSVCEYDSWEHEFTVALQMSLQPKEADDGFKLCHVIAFLEIDSEGLIKGSCEYWADIRERPHWRKDLVDIE